MNVKQSRIARIKRFFKRNWAKDQKSAEKDQRRAEKRINKVRKTKKISRKIRIILLIELNSTVHLCLFQRMVDVRHNLTGRDAVMTHRLSRNALIQMQYRNKSKRKRKRETTQRSDELHTLAQSIIGWCLKFVLLVSVDILFLFVFLFFIFL